MPFSPLDALMQVATPSRPLELPARTDGPGAFAPALEQAYQAETPRAPAGAPPSKPKAEDASASGEKHESEQSADDAIVVADGAQDVKESQEQADQDSDEAQCDDAVEISAVAAAAAGVIQDARNIEQQAIVKSGDAKVDETAVKQVDPIAAAEAVEKQAEGETSSDQPAESIVSAMNSTRRRKPGDKVKDDVAQVGDAATVSADKKNAETSASANVAGEETALKQVREVIIESPAETKSESRKPDVLDETTNNGDDAKQAAQKIDAQAASDAAVTATTVLERVEAVASDVANASSAPTSVDSTPASDASPRTAGALDRLMAGHSLKSTRDASEPNNMPTVDRARFVQRVEGAMKAAQQRDGKIQVRLSPPDLGSVKIELAVQNGVLSAKLEAETLAARNLLLDSLPALRERLAQQDIRVDKFDVDVRDQGGNAGSGQADDRTADQSGERQSGRPRPAAPRAAALASPPSRTSTGASSVAAGLDVRV